MNTKQNRVLTNDELGILGLIQRLYGSQNSEENVSFSDSDEAILFVKDTAGTIGLCVVLTNVARWSFEEGLGEEGICQKYLIPH